MDSKNQKHKMPFNYLLNPGHSACAGCGLILAMRHILQASGADTIITNATGCSEVTTTKYPTTAFKVPWIHANFENAAPVASGIRAALDYKKNNKKTKVIAWGGDGATFDIGFSLISGMWERQEDILYICLDNEAYMNTGIQASGATPLGANTTTTPPGAKSQGNKLKKKNMIDIALAHDCVYVATAGVGDLPDLQNKVKKALSIPGPKYLQVLTGCVPGWHIEPQDTVRVVDLAQKTGFFPVVEYVRGKLESVKKTPRPRPKVEEYLKPQGRFKHLFKPKKDEKTIAKIQKIADNNVKKYNL